MDFNTKIEKQDISEIVNSRFINWSAFKNSTILVTGATGLIGSAIVKSILYANETLNTNIKVIALVRNRQKALKLFGRKVKYVVQDITTPIKSCPKVDYIIHTANSTSSRGFVEQPVETIDSIVQGTKNILDFARRKNIKNTVYLSSMEVFGKTDFANPEPLKENDYGYIDIAELRSSYPEAKRLAENMCVAYSSEYNVSVNVARLVQTIGAGVDYHDNRVFAQFARNVVEQKDIVLHTTGESIRSYCYITDAVVAIFVLLERGQKGEFYNIANEATTTSIKQMAEMLCNTYTASKLKIELNNSMNSYYLPKLKTVLNTSKLQSLNWQAKISLEEMFNRLIQDFYLRPKPLIYTAKDKRNKLKELIAKIFNKERFIEYEKFSIWGYNFTLKRRLRYASICQNTPVQPNKIAFIDNHGEGYSGNLKYIADELIRQNIDCEIVWVDNLSDDVLNNFPSQIRKIQKDTFDSAQELASAKIWVASQRNLTMLKKGLQKKEDQYYIQTWHGSLGIKKVGFDLHPDKEETWMYYAKKDAEMLNYTISNSEFETNVYRGIFWGQGNPKLLGHPRNDIFFANNDDLKSKVKKALNIADNQKIILYAPTYREDHDLTCYNMDYEAVIAEFEKKFGGECVLILRFHPWVLKDCAHLFGNNPKIINGNHYDDIQELLAVSDFMITDYSSCIFDFLFTRKPAFIYASDITKYNNDRGFYYQLETTPFPIANDMKTFITNIADFASASYDAKINDFLKSKGCMEDGNASKRVVELIKQIIKS